MFAKVVCKRGVKVLDSAKVEPMAKVKRARVKDAVSLEDAAKIFWDGLDYEDKLIRFNDWAYDNDADRVVYDNDESNMRELFESPLDAVRAAYYGNYRYPDKYMVFNGDGNLDSYEDVQSLVDNYCTKFDDEVVKYIAETQDNNSEGFKVLFASLNEEE